jgi:glycerol transport system permease protein
MNKTVNQKAWFLILPVLLLVAFSAVIPGDGRQLLGSGHIRKKRVLLGRPEWFEQMLASERMWNALGRRSLAIILAIRYRVSLWR